MERCPASPKTSWNAADKIHCVLISECEEAFRCPRPREFRVRPKLTCFFCLIDFDLVIPDSSGFAGTTQDKFPSGTDVATHDLCRKGAGANSTPQDAPKRAIVATYCGKTRRGWTMSLKATQTVRGNLCRKAIASLNNRSVRRDCPTNLRNVQHQRGGPSEDPIGKALRSPSSPLARTRVSLQ